MMIRIGQLSLGLNPPISFTPAQLRGAIAAFWPEQVLLHQHVNDDEQIKKCELIYMYPRIRYIVSDDATALLLGIEEGVPIIAELAERLKKKRLRLGRLETQIGSLSFSSDERRFGIINDKIDFVSYSFLTPWLALNEKNYDQYQRLGTWPKKKELLEKILIGNIISMSKSLGYTVPEPITANMGQMKEVQTKLKGTPMLGFVGTFSVNFEIPDYWGIGKSVSRGFGTVKRVKELRSCRVKKIV
jgi:hypothetical protein